ncbi:hypothetical protein WNZ15_19835 [Roseibium sp. AS2]|uniref:hypothetical protein n=1 Tax=Roseibium sp. AS2 TaxID=3135781 RepID=UPI00317E8051
MIRNLILLLALVGAHPVWAQAVPEPIVRTALESDTAIPGQPVIFRVTILVPTWMPTPPLFPDFEIPNVIVRLPSRATTAISESIKGETWSGVTRAYRLYPMIRGPFRIPADTIRITYADPATRQPIETQISTGAFEIRGELPPGGEALDPFLAAKSLSLVRTTEGSPEALNAGDALILTTTVTVSGVSPLFVPPLSSASEIDGLAFYAKAPVLDETENRGNLTGTRTEVMTVVAENAGSYLIPAMSLSWYDLESGSVETETVAAIDLRVAGVSLADEPGTEDANAWASIATWLAALVLVAVSAVCGYRVFGHKIRDRLVNLASRFKATEHYSYFRFRRALRAQDYSLALRAGLDWKEKAGSGLSETDWTGFRKSVVDLGQALFDTRHRTGARERTRRWAAVAGEAGSIRRRLRASAKHTSVDNLAPLNPGRPFRS